MHAVCETKSPLLWGFKRLPVFSENFIKFSLFLSPHSRGDFVSQTACIRVAFFFDFSLTKSRNKWRGGGLNLFISGNPEIKFIADRLYPKTLCYNQSLQEKHFSFSIFKVPFYKNKRWSGKGGGVWSSVLLKK